MTRRALASRSDDRPRYIEPLAPVVFPEEAELPETQLHLELRTLLYQLLSDHLGLDTTVGSDQFVYFDAANPKQSVAPDVYVRLLPRGELIRSWKTWERGAPEVAVEIVSDSDASELEWSRKLNAYRSIGVQELVRFEPDAEPSAQLRIWDRVDDALMERVVSSSSAPSSVLDLHWIVAAAEGHPLALRIADEHQAIVPTRTEARTLAEARAQQLEAELSRLRERG
jgi:Uma2 family endonuclease